MSENMYNLNIERAVLSSILFDPYSPESETALTSLTSSDFYLPFHQSFFASAATLIKEEKPVDEEFLKQSMQRDGKFDELCMLDVMSATPVSSMQAYINSIKEKSQKRSLAYLATVMKKEILEEDRPPFEVLERNIKRLENIAENGTVKIGRKSMAYAVESAPDFICKEWLPIPKATLSMIVAPGGSGKALCNNEIVLTPSGWVAMGDLSINDKVIGSDGLEKKIISVHPQGKRDIYKVTFIDGTHVMCDMDHLWTVSDRENDNSWETLTTREIVRNGVLSCEKYDKKHNTYQKEWRYGIPFSKPCEFGFSDFIELHPYLLGVILGDGCITKSDIVISNKSKELLEGLNELLPVGDIIEILHFKDGTWHASIRKTKSSTDRTEVSKYLEKAGLLGLNSEDKFIPDEYFTADLEYRKLLIRGLIDTDGYMKDGQFDEYSTSSTRLAEGFLEIGRSVGMRLSLEQGDTKHKTNGICVDGKMNYRIRERFRNASSKSIISVEFSHRNDATCIKIDAEDSLFVANGYNLTHNTWVALQLAIRAAREDSGRKIFLWLSEDPEGTVKSRYNAIIKDVLYGAKQTEDTQIDICTEDPMLLLETQGRTAAMSSRFYTMKRELREYDVIIIDPLLAFYGGDENDNSQARVFMQPFLNWARSENKSIIFLHHSRKGEGNNASRARGAGAIVDAVRCVYDMDKIYITKSGKQEIDHLSTHMRNMSLTKDNYGAIQFLKSYTVQREITPQKSAQNFEIVYRGGDEINIPYME